MEAGEKLTQFAIRYPRLIAAAMVTIALVLILLAALPTLFPTTFPMLQPLKVDTDPENMLSHEEPVRVFHNRMKEALTLYDMVVLGVVNDKHPNGVFNPASLKRVYELTEFAKTLRWPDKADPSIVHGVVVSDMIAPSVVDNIEQGGPGEVRFDWLMPAPPQTDEEALALREKIHQLPFFEGTMISEDGKALAIYLPLTAKDQSYRVYRALQGKIAGFSGDEEYHITGLPVANDTFGVEMFIQMAISAPMAMVVIFLLMLFFFRKLILIVSPMLLAMFSVIVTMGLLIVTGNTVHIMSSMIPIFIMPIAVLDSIHILSEFFDRYQETRDRERTIKGVMRSLFMPMLYTSLTSSAGFGSLALTPIPPVQVFGIFVAIGILTAWLFTVLFIPAYIMLIPQRKLENFGAVHSGDDEEDAHAKTLTGRFLAFLGELTYVRTKLILAFSLALVFVAGYGISRIVINDNPTKWFKASHPIRVADTVLNSHFGGTYTAYLALLPPDEANELAGFPEGFEKRLDAFSKDNGVPAETVTRLLEEAGKRTPGAPGRAEILEALVTFTETQARAAEGDAIYAWEDLTRFIESEQQRLELFKQPEVLRYMVMLQEALNETEVVGKSNSLADLVKTVYRELMEGEEEYFRIPETANAVAQTLITFESSHRPQDLYHFVTPDYRHSSLWVQLKSGDNQDMTRVVQAVEDFIERNPPSMGLHTEWFGLTYINVIWQEKMVSGMLQAFLGSFLVVLLMMIVLFRSALWGLISMIPLTITIGLIYGVIGYIGKDYDMPVAVLSSLTLGLAVDFAIHFLARSRDLYAKYGSWEKAHGAVFGEPARAITRNVIVIAVGFLPLLLAPLVPYITVGVFLAAILFVSGAGTLLILPSLVKVAEPLLFPQTQLARVTCHCGTCIVTGVTALALAAVNIHQFLTVGWTMLTWISLAVLPVLTLICFFMSRRASCGAAPDSEV